MTKLEAVAGYAEEKFDTTVATLSEYLRIPAISCEAEHSADVMALAKKIRDDLEALSFSNAKVLEMEGALPCVIAENLEAGPGKPTLLVYGHFDLQPVKGEPWNTPPHEAVIKDGRLYARGAADDMGGWVSHLAALEAYKEIEGSFPLNIKMVIEGEEEIGSPNLEAYMDAYPEAFESDVMVLTDCENPGIDIPGLTVSLRGLLEMDVGCFALENDVHSGLWGNGAPDASTALVKVLNGLLDDSGRLKVGRVDVPAEWRKAAYDAPLSAESISADAHIIEGAKPLPEDGRPYAEWLWRQPALTILSTNFPVLGGEKNALRRSAEAVLSIRVAPGQSRDELKEELVEALKASAPVGIRLEIKERPGGADSWLYVPKGPAFDAADRAYEKVWGRKMLQIGIGGSIPFVALFGRRFGDLPLILNGVMDPQTGAHGPNESMHLGIFKKAIMTNIYLYEELAQLSELNRPSKD